MASPVISRASLKRRIDRLPEQNLAAVDQFLQSIEGLRSVFRSLQERPLRAEPGVDQAFQKLEAWARSAPSVVKPPSVRFRTEEDWRAWVTSFHGVAVDDSFERGDQGTFEERESFE